MAILDPVRERFRALASTIVPETGELDPAGWQGLESIVEEALAARPAAMRRQLVVFIRLLDVLPLFRWGRTFRRLDRQRRVGFLHGVQNARLFLFRRGFWGLRTLVYMGYYGRPEAHGAIGYDARLRGWLEHPAATEAARAATRAGLTGGASRESSPSPGNGGEPAGEKRP
jgi:hypothetical protein